ncbi:MAG: septal ring lytic transglycosylase RlpA family protein, partial [Terriglobia bacterium]
MSKSYFAGLLGVGLALAGLGLLLLQSPGAARADTENPLSPEPLLNASQVLEGKASWYGLGFHGRPTASGVLFNRNALTAAHRTLRAGTVVRVTNLRNGRSTV